MYEFTEIGWLKHCIFHPVEGFEDLRWKKKGSLNGYIKRPSRKPLKAIALPRSTR